MKVIAIAAVAENGVIGNDLVLPWNIPEDMKFFRDSTRDQIVVMGRKTFDSLGQPLPKRENAVVTRNENWKRDGVRVFSDLPSAISHYRENEASFAGKNIFVIGGAQIYRESFPFLDEVWLTEIAKSFEGNVFFPDFKAGAFHRPEFAKAESRPGKDSRPELAYDFVRYLRIRES